MTVRSSRTGLAGVRGSMLRAVARAPHEALHLSPMPEIITETPDQHAEEVGFVAKFTVSGTTRSGRTRKRSDSAHSFPRSSEPVFTGCAAYRLNNSCARAKRAV